MLPSAPDPETPHSERRVFEQLADSLPTEWTVIHSRRITLPAEGRHRAFQSEADFLIIAPDRGVLVLEVKGGKEVGCRAGEWYSVDHGGVTHKIKDPAAQVERVMHRIQKLLAKQNQSPEGRRFAWAVCFPGVETRQSPDPGLPRPHIVDSTDMSDITAAVRGAFDAQSIDAAPMTARDVRRIVDGMSPIFRFTRSLAAQIRNQEAVLLQMTEEQYEVLDMLDDNTRVMIEGAAGTGKTLVAMEHCRRVAKKGLSALLLCFNKELAAHLRKQSRGFEVQTFHAKAMQLCKRAVLQLPSELSPGFWQSELPELMQQAIDALPDERFGAVVVDEGQDFEEMWWLPIQSLLRDREASHLFVFLDPLQNLYGRDLQRELGSVRAKLTFNCRNTQSIGVHSGAFVDSQPRFRPATPSGDGVRRLSVTSESEMIEALRQELHRIVREGSVSNRNLVILSPLKKEKSPVWAKRKIGPFELVDLQTTMQRSDQVRFSSIHGFKGLEADAIVLVDLTQTTLRDHARLLHVGSSRAKHLLTEILLQG